jgi:hypothetical protein
MLLGMTGRGSRKPGGRSQAQAARGSGGNVRKLRDPEASFPAALAELLRSRKIRVPTGLESAPRQAYASQPPSFIEHLAALSNGELQQYAAQIAGYARRQAKRAKDAWEASPLIAELRRRGLAEPPCPVRVVGASVSLTKPLGEWSDGELVRAANEWSRMGQS